MGSKTELKQRINDLAEDLTSRWGNPPRAYKWVQIIPKRGSLSGSYDAALIINYAYQDSLVFLFVGGSEGKIVEGTSILVSTNFSGKLSDEVFVLSEDAVCHMSELGKSIELKEAVDTVDRVTANHINFILNQPFETEIRDSEFCCWKVSKGEGGGLTLARCTQRVRIGMPPSC